MRFITTMNTTPIEMPIASPSIIPRSRGIGTASRRPEVLVFKRIVIDAFAAVGVLCVVAFAFEAFLLAPIGRNHP
jgi:hypothetical protein